MMPHETAQEYAERMIALANKALSEPPKTPAPLTGEAYFIDRDIFTRYVAEKVNPARVAEGLDRITSAAAYACYDIINSGRYRH